MPARPAKKAKPQSRSQKRKRDHVQLDELEKAVEDLDPKAGPFKTFADLPLSEPTRAGLKSGRFKTLTDIQAKAIPSALKGRDILGAAKTGSGKTLAFAIPVLENLYREQCIGADAGLAAIIISPTRELAIQIFDVLYKVGRQGHMFAAGLIIGGKSLAEEQSALLRMNIVVCTPGRILQHLSQTSFFHVDNLRMLVLDEADRIMDMGFQHDVDAIMDYLPKEGRQTMLFSATQTRRISDLARLNLKDPEYISVHEEAPSATPRALQQTYIVTPLADKLDTLWSFLQTAKKAKTVCFLSSGKQVRFVYEAFCKLQPGVPLLHLHGRQKQMARLAITQRFASSRHACLFATDVAARGLDFPAVDWVVQADCPEDADTYIHRAGRTARYEREGKAVLFLTPSEEPGMLERLSAKRVPIERVGVRQKKQSSIRERLQLMCFQDNTLKYLGQTAFVSYVRSVFLQKDKTIFPEDADLPLEDFALSLGLRTAPKIKTFKKDPKSLKNMSTQLLADDSDADGEVPQPTAKPVRTKVDRMFGRKNQDVLADHYRELIHSDEEALHNSDDGKTAGGLDGSPDSDDDDDLLAVKRRIRASQSPSPSPSPSPSSPPPQSALPNDSTTIQPPGFTQPLVIDSKRRAKMLTSKKAMLKHKERGQRLVFDDDTGEARPAHQLDDEAAFRAVGRPEDQRKTYVERGGEALQKADVEDRGVQRERMREKKEKRKAQEKAERRARSGAVETDDDGGIAGNGGDDDLLANFIDDARASISDESEVPDLVEAAPTRPKKWFEEDPDETKRRKSKGKKRKVERREVQTLEDLEAAAAGLLG